MKWTVTVDLLTTYLGFVHIQTEYTLSRSISIYAGPHLRLFSAPGSEREPYRGYGAETGVRFKDIATKQSTLEEIFVGLVEETR